VFFIGHSYEKAVSDHIGGESARQNIPPAAPGRSLSILPLSTNHGRENERTCNTDSQFGAQIESRPRHGANEPLMRLTVLVGKATLLSGGCLPAPAVESAPDVV